MMQHNVVHYTTMSSQMQAAEPLTIWESHHQDEGARAMSRKVRLTVDVTEELNNVLESIAEETGGTKSEVFRKAIALIDVAHKAKRDGKHVGIAGQNRQLETEFVGL